MITTVRTLQSKLLPLLRYHASHKNSLINATPTKYADQRVALKENNWKIPDPTHLVHTKLSRNQHKPILAMASTLYTKCQLSTQTKLSLDA